LRWTLS